MGMEFLLVMMLGMGTGNDLLDYMSSDYYWQMQGVAAVNAQAMSDILDDNTADATQRLMAIRTLGELGDDAALGKLEPLVDSNEPFVGIYARRSIAWIKGADPERLTPVSAEDLAKDVALLPPDSTMAAQLSMKPGMGPIDWNALLPDFPQGAGPNKQEMIAEVSRELYQLIEMIGNVRLDSITFGTNFNQDDDDGTIYLIARGEYDRFRVIDLLQQEDDEFKGYSVGDTEVLVLQEEWQSVAFVMPTDQMLVFLFNADGQRQLPIDEVVDLVENGDAQLALDAEMLGQYEKIDTQSARAWFITSVPPVLMQDNEFEEIFGPLEAARIVATDAEDGKDLIEIQWVGEGKDEAEVAAAVEVLNGYLDEGRAGIREEIAREPEMRAMFEPFVEMMDSMRLTADGKNMTGGMLVPANMGIMMPMIMMYGF